MVSHMYFMRAMQQDFHELKPSDTQCMSEVFLALFPGSLSRSRREPRNEAKVVYHTSLMQ